MKTKTIIYSTALMLMLGAPLARYYTTTDGENKCMIEYTDKIESVGYRGYFYDIKGMPHIEPGDSKNIESLREYQTGKAIGCLIADNNLIVGINNTFYCSVSYLIKKTNVNQGIKNVENIPKEIGNVISDINQN